MSRILRLESENVLPLKAIEIVPDGSVVKIAGANDAGKTAILRCIWMPLGGKKEIPPDAIRKGQDKGHIVLELGDNGVIEFTAQLNFTRRPDGTIKAHDVILKNAEGRTQSSVMSKLSDMLGFGRGQFDPLVFRDAKPAEQVKMLKTALGLDYSELDAEYKEQYDNRTKINGEAKTLAAQIPEVDPDAPAKEYSAALLTEELEGARSIEAANDARVRAINTATTNWTTLESDHAGLVQKQQELMADLKELGSRLTAKAEAVEMAEIKMSELEKVPAKEVPDIDEIKERIKTVESDNAKARDKIRHGELTKQVDELKAQSATITNSLATIDATKEKMIADADFPIPGVKIGDGEILINGHPLVNQGSSAQLRFGSLLVIKSDPKLRIITIDEGLGKLDDESLEMLEVIGDEYDFQFWLTGPRAVGEGCIVISAGEVVNETGDK